MNSNTILHKFGYCLILSSLTVPTLFATKSAFKWRSIPHQSFALGEELVFKVGWQSAGAGEVRLKVQEKGVRKNRPAFRIVCEASTNSLIDNVFKVRDRFESWLDLDALCSLGFSQRIQEGSYERIQEVFLDPRAGTFKARTMRPNKDSKPELEEGKAPAFVQDVVSILYFLRTQEFKVGSTIQVPLMNRTDLQQIQFHVRRKEAIETDLGQKSCFVLEPYFQTDKGFGPHPKAALFFWMTDDKRHLPVKVTADMSFGHIDAYLSEVN